MNFQREINLCQKMRQNILSPHVDAQQNFRIFLVGLHSRSIIHHFVPCCKKSEIMMYFLNMSN